MSENGVFSDKPLISVITAVYNREDTIDRCIESVLGQEYSDYELIVVDDGSTDNTYNILRKYVPNDKIKLVTLPVNKGVNFARNRGIELAIGEFITFLDSDDYFVQNGLSELAHEVKLEATRNHFLFFVMDKDNRHDNLTRRNVFFQDWIRGEIIGDYLHVVRAKVLKELLFFEDVKAFENLNWLRVFRATEPLLLIPKKLVIVELGRSDSLSQRYYLNNITALKNEYAANLILFDLYHNEFSKFGVTCEPLIIKTIFIGLILNEYENNKNIIRLVNNKFIKITLSLFNMLHPHYLFLMLFNLRRFANRSNWVKF